MEAAIERGGIISDRQNWQEADMARGSRRPMFRQTSQLEHPIKSLFQLFPGVNGFLQ